MNRDTSDNIVTVPGLIGRDLSTIYDWNLTTTPQSFLDNETRPYNAGRVVGGSSVLNGMVWTRGSAADYDAWEALGNPGWGWEGLLPYFKKVSAQLFRRNCLSLANPSSLARARDSPRMSKLGQVGLCISIRTCQHMAPRAPSRSAIRDSSTSNQVWRPVNTSGARILTLMQRTSSGDSPSLASQSYTIPTGALGWVR